MQNGVQFLGDSLPTGEITIKNMTGVALVIGGVYALDLTRANADTTDSRKSVSNIVAVSAANIDGILVVAKEKLAAGETGGAIVSGPARVLVDGDAADVAAGDRLKATAGTNTLTKASKAVGSVDIAVGKALEANAGVAALKDVYFMGLNLNVSTNAAVS